MKDSGQIFSDSPVDVTFSSASSHCLGATVAHVSLEIESANIKIHNRLPV